MCTSQKYEGKGDSVQNSSPAVNSDPQTSSAADERQPLTNTQICNAIDIISGLTQQGRFEESRVCLNGLKAQIAQLAEAGDSITQILPVVDKRQQDIDEYEQYVNKDFEEMLSIVVDLNAATNQRHPIQVLAELLRYWLGKANPNFEADQYRNQMEGALETINAWRQLAALSESIYYNRQEIDQLRKGGRGE